MLSYHQDRIRSDYIPTLGADFKGYDATDKYSSSQSHSILDVELSVLRKLAFDVINHGQTIIDQCDKLVTAAFELRMTKSTEELTQSSTISTTKTKKLWVDICLLARIRVTFQKFEKIALKLPSFIKVTIILVLRNSISVKPPEDPLSLKQTFGVLKTSLDSTTVKSMIGQGWSCNRVERGVFKTPKAEAQHTC